MSKIEWDKKYEVGNFEIDAEHKIFVTIIQKIMTAQEQAADQAVVEALLYELLKYAEFHFCSEENVMIAHQYPEIIAHKKEHERVLAELRNRIFSLKHQYIDFAQLETFLLDWFTQHTTSEDKKLATYINENSR